MSAGLHIQHNWTSHGDRAADDMVVAGQIMTELNRHYPGHQWDVTADHEAGVATIKLLYENQPGRVSSYGCLLHLTRFSNVTWAKRVMMVGGELLERWNLRRGSYREGDKLRAKQNGLLTANAVLKSRY